MTDSEVQEIVDNFYSTLPGGEAEGLDPHDFELESIKKGIAVELEHTTDPNVALEIAMDHLAEDEDYYEKHDHECEVCDHKHPEITTWLIPLYIGLGVMIYLYYKKSKEFTA